MNTKLLLSTSMLLVSSLSLATDLGVESTLIDSDGDFGLGVYLAKELPVLDDSMGVQFKARGTAYLRIQEKTDSTYQCSDSNPYDCYYEEKVLPTKSPLLDLGVSAIHRVSDDSKVFVGPLVVLNKATKSGVAFAYGYELGYKKVLENGTGYSVSGMFLNNSESNGYSALSISAFKAIDMSECSF